MRTRISCAGVFCVAAALGFAQPPVRVAARVELREGIIRLALLNTRSTAVRVTMRVVAAEGAELPTSSFGVTIAPRGVWARAVPVRGVTSDQPVLDCVLVYDGTNVARQRVTCQSGAWFREASAANASTVTLRHAAVAVRATAEGAREVHVGGHTILADLAACFGTERALPWSSSNSVLFTQLQRGTSAMARAILTQKTNGRGDVVLSLLTEVCAPGCTTNDVPGLSLRLPPPLLSNSLVVTRVRGIYHFFPAAELSGSLTSPLLTGPTVEEWSVVTERDWLVFTLDASYLEAQAQSDGLLLRFTSRTPWEPPFPPGRCHTTLVRIHLPVGILP